jgi:hypothetical protein
MPEIGTTGLNEYGGLIQEDPIQKLRFGMGGKAYEIYTEMRLNTPVIAALISAVTQSVRSATWTFTSDEGEDDPRLELIEAARQNLARTISLDEHLAEATEGTAVYGWSLFEQVWENVGGRILWSNLSIRGQNTLANWEIDQEGHTTGMCQWDIYSRRGKVIIPFDKAVLYRFWVQRENPEGMSLLRPAYVPWYYYKNISKIEAIGIERDLAGLPVITLPPGASTDSSSASDLSKAEKTVRNVRNDEQAGFVKPSPDWGFELLSTGGTRQFDTNAIIQRYENRILMSALAQFLLLGTNGTGSLALSKDQTDFFTMSVTVMANSIARAFTNTALRRLMIYNGQNPDGIRLTASMAGDTDIIQMADFLQKTADKITWTPQDEKWLRSIAAMPEIDEMQIESERMAENDRAERMARALEGRQAQAPVEDEGAPDDDIEDRKEETQRMSADWFASRRQTDKQRRVWEGRFQKIMSGYLASQRKRVIAGAKGARNG